MAEPIVRTFEIDTAKSEQNLRQLGSALDSADNSGKSLRAQLRELNQQLANTDPQTQKYRDLSIAAGELKDRMQDAAQAVGTQAGGAFEKVSGSIGLVTSRLVSLDFQGAAEGAKLFAQNASSIKLKDVSEGVKGLTSTLGTLGKALLTNPIFLLGSVIVGIIANFDALKASGGALGRFLTGLSDIVTSLKEGFISFFDAIGFTSTKAAEDAEKAAQRTKEALASVKEFADQITTDVEKRSADIIKASGGNLREARAQFKEYSDQVKQANQNLIDQANLIVERGGKLDEYQQQRLDAAIKENAALDKALADINKSIREEDKKTAEEAKRKTDERLRREKEISLRLESEEKARTAALLAETKKREQIVQNYYDKLAALQDAQYASTLSAQEKEELAIIQKYEDLFAAADAAGIATIDLQKQLSAELLAIQQTTNTAEVANTQTTEETKTQLKSDGFKKGIELAASAIQILQAFSNASNKNNEKDAKRKFRTDKALAIGAATLQTAAAVTGALTAGGNPVKLATGAQFVEASIAAALGLAQIVKIKNTEFGGGGGNDSNVNPSIPSTTDNTSQPATFNPFAAQFVTNRPDQYLPRAYVLAGDVSSQQEVRENVEDLARIG
jgi:hypothetical protein